MRIERDLNYKSLWFCYKIISWWKCYISLWINSEYNCKKDFVIFKIDWSFYDSYNFLSFTLFNFQVLKYSKLKIINKKQIVIFGFKIC